MKKSFTPFWARSGLPALPGYWNSLGRSGGTYWSLYPEDVDTSSSLSRKAQRYREVRNRIASESRRRNR